MTIGKNEWDRKKPRPVGNCHTLQLLQKQSSLQHGATEQGGRVEALEIQKLLRG